ncbi:MAG: helix-turn-helix transcriptional regulator [Verrucomicrobia bacterium]|nr:helix-turn-helix transcriptional regulator [Verrucomicrobiota bacterium]
MPVRDKSLVLLGLKVRQLREAAGLTQEVLATRAKLDITYISGIERGLRNPSLLALRQVAEGLGIKISQLVKGLDS